MPCTCTAPRVRLTQHPHNTPKRALLCVALNDKRTLSSFGPARAEPCGCLCRRLDNTRGFACVRDADLPALVYNNSATAPALSENSCDERSCAALCAARVFGNQINIQMSIFSSQRYASCARRSVTRQWCLAFCFVLDVCFVSVLLHWSACVYVYISGTRQAHGFFFFFLHETLLLLFAVTSGVESKSISIHFVKHYFYLFFFCCIFFNSVRLS